MKLQKIQRPEIEVEFVGVKGFLLFLKALCKVGLIKKAHIDYTIKLCDYTGTVKRRYFYIIPKFKLKRVTKIDESESEENAC